nr:hypothetical protein [uncultured Rhizobium sp.]
MRISIRLKTVEISPQLNGLKSTGTFDTKALEPEPDGANAGTVGQQK